MYGKIFTASTSNPQNEKLGLPWWEVAGVTDNLKEHFMQHASRPRLRRCQNKQNEYLLRNPFVCIFDEG